MSVGRNCIAAVVLVALGLGTSPALEPAERGVPHTHAHNDYAHEHPLFDALHEGFVGVEADIYLVGNELRVAHDKVEDWTTVPTLEASYLTPLSDLAKRRKGRGIYADGTRLLLLVDIKTEDEPTYRRLHDVLATYQAANPGLFTVYRKREDRYSVQRGAVDVVVTGNRPRRFMAHQDLRYAAYDGRLSDLAAGPVGEPPEFIPLISDNWKNVFGDKTAWDGTGEMPVAMRAKLSELVGEAHKKNKMVRFWNVPKDTPETWGPLLDAGVDLINTDDLAGLARFMKSRRV